MNENETNCIETFEYNLLYEVGVHGDHLQNGVMRAIYLNTKPNQKRAHNNIFIFCFAEIKFALDAISHVFICISVYENTHWYCCRDRRSDGHEDWLIYLWYMLFMSCPRSLSHLLVCCALVSRAHLFTRTRALFCIYI